MILLLSTSSVDIQFCFKKDFYIKKNVINMTLNSLNFD